MTDNKTLPDFIPSDNEIWKAVRSLKANFSSDPLEIIKPIKDLFTPLNSELLKLREENAELNNALDEQVEMASNYRLRYECSEKEVKDTNIKLGTRINDLLHEAVKLKSKLEDKEKEIERLKAGWISVKDSPLVFFDEHNRWEATKDGMSDFMAAVPLRDGTWWIKHCILEDEIGLCVIGEDDNEVAGWTIEDVTHYMKIEPPKI